MINSRSLDDLSPEALEVCRRHIALCNNRGIELLVTSTYRDNESQESLYAIGRTREFGQRKVTNARGGQSWHNYRCAWDVVPLVGGKCVWSPIDPLWAIIIDFGIQAGAEAGAKWISFPDFPHFQVVPTIHGLKINYDEARERFEKSGTIFIPEVA